MITKLLSKIVEGRDLSEKEMEDAFEFIMEGRAKPTQIAAFLTALRMKGETVEEVSGAVRAMRRKAKKIEVEKGGRLLLDMCGTGGDSLNTFNISTASSIVVAAAAGVMVAKHGNRSVSSRSGSADVLEALGVKIDLEPELVRRCIEKVGIGFLFAPIFHDAMRHAASPRREIGIRTIFNILGPLTNPAPIDVQVIGVFSPDLTEKIANVLKRIGIKEAMVVSGLDGMDEVSICASTVISHLKDGEIRTFEITPEQFGIKRAAIEEIRGGDARDNAEIIRRIFEGDERGAKRDAVILNSSLGLVVSGKARDIREGIEMAKEVIDRGNAMKKLEELIRFTQGIRDGSL